MINITSDYFERFDQLLISHSAGLQLYTSTQPPNVESVRKFVFKDLLSVEGEYQKDLADFILWILSNNERELFFCKSCNIKFQQHSKAEYAELAKVFIYSDSRCQVHKKNQDWARKCYILWNRHCEKTGSSLSSRSDILSTQSGHLASKSEVESFHKRALSSVTEMLLPSMDETDINALDSLSRINLHKPTNKFHSMESFYAPDIESIKDSAFSPPLRSVITPERRHENEELSALRIYLSSQPTHVDGPLLPSDIKYNDEDCHTIESQGSAESKEVEEEVTPTIQPPLTPVPQDSIDRAQQSPMTPVRMLPDTLDRVPSDGESGPINKVYIMKLYKELGDVKKQLQTEKQEKEALSAELKTTKSDAAELRDKYTKSANDSRVMEKQTREVLQRYVHLQKTTDSEMAEMRDRLVSLKEELSQRNTAVIGSLEKKSNDSNSGMGEEKYSENKSATALCDEFATPLSISNDAGELNEIKTEYNDLFNSSRSNIQKLRTSFHELTIQHKHFETILDRTKETNDAKGSSSTDLTRMDKDFKTMHDKYERLHKLSKAENHSIRSLYMEASDAYVSDLALSDIRGQEGRKIFETEMAILKAKCEITARANNELQSLAKDHHVELEQLEKTTELENKRLQRALEKSDRELRRVQFKMDADLNLANVEIQQLKSDALAYSEQVFTELKQQEQNLYDAKAIHETDLRVKTQSLQNTIAFLQHTIAEQKKTFAEQLQAKSTQELRTKEVLEQTIECLRQSIEEQKRQIEELEQSVVSAQESVAAAQESVAAAQEKAVVQELVPVLDDEKCNDSFSNQILEYIVPQAEDQPGIATTSEDTHSLFNEYVGPQDRDGISISSETLGTLSKSQDNSQDQLTSSKNSEVEVDEPLTSNSMAPSLDLTRIYLKDKDKDPGEEEMVLSSASNNSAHEEFTNPLFKCSSQRLSTSDFDMTRFIKNHAIIVVDKSHGRESDSVFTLSTTDNDSLSSKSVTYGNSISVTIVGDPEGTDRNDDPYYNNTTATSTVVTTTTTTTNPKQSRGSNPKDLYTKALLKSRVLSNSNIVSRMSRDSQDFSKDKEMACSTFNDVSEDDETRKDVKRLKRSSSSSSIASPVASPVVLSSVPLPTDSQHHFFEELVPSNNPGIDLRFDEAIKIYSEDEELFGRPSSNLNSLGGGEGGGDLRKPEFFSNPNPLFVRSRSASSYKHMDGINIINSLASVSKPHSDGVSSITGPEDSRSLSTSIDNTGLLQPELLTSHTRSVLQLSKVLGLSTTAVFDGG